jgi:hypothetical protein
MTEHEHERDWASALLDAAPDAMVVVDRTSPTDGCRRQLAARRKDEIRAVLDV